ncbi:MAG: CpaF family protein [Lachnospiraceae bacterium]|nr:CpaF family protein [Lachnospiraceae bacterium]
MECSRADIVRWKKEIRKELWDQVRMDKTSTDEEILELIEKVLWEKSRDTYISVTTRQKIQKEVFNSLRRLDILQELLEDESITEIMVNGWKNIFIEREGRISRYEKEFESVERLEDIVQQIAASANRRINERDPIMDACMPDGSRINVVLPPIAVDGPIVTIRRFSKEPMTMEKLIALGALDEEVACFLRKLVVARYNILISGGTGSGKTTFLNALSQFIPSGERIVTIEDSRELNLSKIENLVTLEARNANVEGENQVSIRDLIKTALRMRPTRIIIGEVRDGAAFDMLQAMNTGHDGSISTAHANSPKDMLSRLESMVIMGVDLPIEAIRRQVGLAVDIIIHLGRLRDYTRRVLEIQEVYLDGDGNIRTQTLYEFKEEGVEESGRIIGRLEAMKTPLRQRRKLERAGLSEDG